MTEEAASAGGSLRAGLRVALVAASCALAGCAMPPATEGGAAGNVDASVEGASRLRPLSPQLSVPPGSSPRSSVPSVRYDLAVAGTGLPPDDGVGGGTGEIFERGGASWYGAQFHQRRTASGERFDMTALTAAHKTLAFNTRVCVRSLVNGSEVLVRVNDRGPYAAGRVIDLSRAAADRIGLTGLGIKQVALTVIDREGMRCGGTQVTAAEVQGGVQLAEQPRGTAKAPVVRRKAAAPPARRRR